jgi:hypothetical protein
MSEHRFSTTVVLCALVVLAAGALWLSEGTAEAVVDLAGPSRVVTDSPRIRDDEQATIVPRVIAPRVQTGQAPELPGADARALAPALSAPPSPASGVPVRLSLPTLGVDAPVVPVGLESDGTMQIPGAQEAGWYSPGRRPGAATGSAVIAAHIDYGGRVGVFFRLPELQVGAEISVQDDEGTVHRFVVTERFQVGKADLPVEELFRTGGGPTLTLITCGGAFDPDERRYRDNIVVRATRL